MQANVEDYLDSFAQGAASETGKRFSIFVPPNGYCGKINSSDGSICPGSDFGDYFMDPSLPQSSPRQSLGKKFSSSLCFRLGLWMVWVVVWTL
jgi:hypothetical protein